LYDDFTAIVENQMRRFHIGITDKVRIATMIIYAIFDFLKLIIYFQAVMMRKFHINLQEIDFV
jgi:hypothetical protein